MASRLQFLFDNPSREDDMNMLTPADEGLVETLACIFNVGFKEQLRHCLMIGLLHALGNTPAPDLPSVEIEASFLLATNGKDPNEIIEAIAKKNNLLPEYVTGSCIAWGARAMFDSSAIDRRINEERLRTLGRQAQRDRGNSDPPQ